MSVSNTYSSSSSSDSYPHSSIFQTITMPKAPSVASSSADQDLDKFTNSLKNKFSLTEEKASVLAQNIIRKQRNSKFLKNNPDCSKFIAASENFPYPLLLKQNAVYTLIKAIGLGAESEVFTAVMIATTRHTLDGETASPSNPRYYVVKRNRPDKAIHSSKKGFSPQKRLLQKASGPLPIPGTDRFLDTFRDKENNFYSVNEEYKYDLYHTPFHTMDTPAKRIIEALIDVSYAVSTFHKNNYIHGDIKGANILTSRNNVTGKVNAAITDFGTLRQAATEPHFTTTTVLYLDPRNFGITPDMSLSFQKAQWGIQSKECDVYALGLTIYRDVILRYVTALRLTNEQKKTLVPLLVKVMHQEVVIKDGDLSKLGADEFLIYYATDKLFKYAPSTEVEESLIKICTCVKDCFSNVKEFESLVELSKLACEMRRETRSERPTMQQVHERLTTIYNNMNNATDDHVILSSSDSSTPPRTPPYGFNEVDLSCFEDDTETSQDCSNTPCTSRHEYNTVAIPPFDPESESDSESESGEFSTTQLIHNQLDEVSQTQPINNYNYRY